MNEISQRCSRNSKTTNEDLTKNGMKPNFNKTKIIAMAEGEER